EVSQDDCCQNPGYGYEAEDGSCHSCGPPTWSPWSSWSYCNVLCGEGVKQRRRKCHGIGECEGPDEKLETDQEPCEASNKCPVHGSWSTWTAWSQCSGSCISDTNVPSRERQRACSSPAPSTDTVPPGNQCPGDAFERQDCSELPNCPVDGNWGYWFPPGPCSVTCGEGLHTQSSVCKSPCPGKPQTHTY
uniref:Properdin n=1 Tax=Fundulus heteroclitus TaxID=8078 RepID=A0A3Q2PXK6_FUNHE